MKLNENGLRVERIEQIEREKDTKRSTMLYEYKVYC